MKITNANETVIKDIGSYIDVEKIVFGYYPKKISESTSGKILLDDSQCFALQLKIMGSTPLNVTLF